MHPCDGPRRAPDPTGSTRWRLSLTRNHVGGEHSPGSLSGREPGVADVEAARWQPPAGGSPTAPGFDADPWCHSSGSAVSNLVVRGQIGADYPRRRSGERRLPEAALPVLSIASLTPLTQSRPRPPVALRTTSGLMLSSSRRTVPQLWNTPSYPAASASHWRNHWSKVVATMRWLWTPEADREQSQQIARSMTLGGSRRARI